MDVRKVIFSDRGDAGRQIARQMVRYRDDAPTVLALPRGGVAVGLEVARELSARLEVVVSCKIGAPGLPEFGIAALAEEGVRVVDELAVRLLAVGPEQLETMVTATQVELARRIGCFRGSQPLSGIQNRTVILVDDGLASGVTVRAAVQALRRHQPSRLVLAVPVGPAATVRALRPLVDDLLCLATPDDFTAVSDYYRDFAPVSDETVTRLLDAGGSTAHCWW